MQRLGRFLLLLCTLAAAPAAAEPFPLPVVASFSILGDFLREVGGDAVAVSVIVGPNSDAHVYEPTPADARKVNEARLVFVNGLGFEGWFDRLVAAADAKSRVVVASAGIAPRKLDGGLDPHAWQNVANARRYVENIRDALKAADPQRAAFYEARAAAYLATLEALDKEVAAAVAAIPKQKRRIVSTHDAFGYFSARYGLEFIAPEGVSTEAEPSARDIARIIDAARREKVAAVFLENISDPRLAQRLAKESGVKLGGELYSDALSKPDGPAASYVAMMRHNVGELTKALGR
ncbi:MAG: zinc ABC transporter substrate-binding protein [Methylocystis sp.]